MAAPVARVVIACPTCDEQFEDWWRPMLDPDVPVTPDTLDQSLPVACPACGAALDWDLLEERGGVFTLLTDDLGGRPVPDEAP